MVVVMIMMMILVVMTMLIMMDSVMMLSGAAGAWSMKMGKSRSLLRKRRCGALKSGSSLG